MGEVAEQNQWFKEKSKVLDEFSGSHRILLSAIAGRGFCKSPGFLMEASLVLEEAGKNKLSALNYQIVSEAITRELKQTGHDYSQIYKAARIAFELEKQTLLTALQQEFANLDATQSLKKEELDRLFVELGIRKLILITTKTSIELQMEVLKQELVDIDRLTFTNETLLINEQVTTATAKLAVIPYLESLIESQGKLLVAEEANLPYMEDLINEKELLISKKNEIIPFINEKAEEQLILSEALSEQIEFKKEMLGIALDKILLKEDVVDNRIDILDAEILVEDMRQLLIDERHNLVTDKLDKEKEFISKDSTNIGLIEIERAGTLTQTQNDKVSVRGDNEDAEVVITDADILKVEADKNTSITAHKDMIFDIASARADATRKTAESAASAKITSELIHLIGS